MQGKPVCHSVYMNSTALLRMSATGRFFLKVQCTIIQAILSRKLMKKIIVTDEKIFRVYKAVDRKK